MKKVLLLGATGLLGSNIYKALNQKFTVIPTARKISHSKKYLLLDITNYNQLKNIIEQYNPDVIINCIAFTDVDKAEEQKKTAYDINVKTVKNIVKASSKDSKILHISSDYVFDGKKDNYIETDSTFPVNYYGRTKLEAENILIGSNRDVLIFRLNVLFDGNKQKNNFFSWVCSALLNKEKINVAIDQISNPVYIPDFIDILIDSILLNYSGLYHYGSLNPISRYEFAINISKLLEIETDLINPVSTNSLKQIAKRPSNSFLNCDKIKSDFNIDLFSNKYNIQRAILNR